MDITMLNTMISTVGFPIACVIAMFYMLDKEREAHEKESDKWTEAINNNTKVMEQLIAKLTG